MMLLPLAFALLAQPLSGGPRLAGRPGPPDYDPQERVCKYERAPGSRLAHRRICRTAAQWDEERRIERGALVRHQFNGAQ